MLFYLNGIDTTSMTSKNVTVTIKQGNTSYEVLEQLDEAGLVNSRLAGRIYMKFCASPSPVSVMRLHLKATSVGDIKRQRIRPEIIDGIYDHQV